ncbi:hypothetical protein FLONG3_5024 [Fusarium longipes]|uniref:Rhodopsin domain-containing protein n=1 Tax=Fusarium longipes TaxID=694270 RepID=A0A395SWT8_9HYPO|nr:hypothetical protein FLONG3_5024 [Fusarium longipes]
MVAEGEGPWVLASMWSLTFVSLIFVVLRIYTRVYVVKSFGIDDHMYNLAFVLLLINTILMTVGVHYGLGQNLTDLVRENPDHLPLALLYEAASQAFAIIAMSIAKWSLGLFLLRLVKERWHKIAICAGAFGIKRTLEVPKLRSPNHTKDPMGLIVWSAAEITVTMVCIGIPVCRPLYKKCFKRWTSRGSSNYPNSGASYPLQTIGGGILPAKRANRNGSASTSDTQDQIRNYEPKFGMGGPFARTKVYPKNDVGRHGDDQSEEEILGPEFRRSQIIDLETQNGGTRSIRTNEL